MVENYVRVIKGSKMALFSKASFYLYEGVSICPSVDQSASLSLFSRKSIYLFWHELPSVGPSFSLGVRSM